MLIANLLIIQILAKLAVNPDRICYLRLNVSQPHYIQISAFITVATDFIDTGMKLPNGQPNNPPIRLKMMAQAPSRRSKTVRLNHYLQALR